MLERLSQYRGRIEKVLGIERIKKRLEERRHRRFAKLFNFPNKGSVIDISCGDGDFLQSIHSYLPDLRLHGVDIAPASIERAKTKCPMAEFTIARAESLPYADASFEVALSCMSLHHYAKSLEVLRQTSRVLKPGGRFYLIDFMPLNRLTQMLHNWDGCPEPYHFEKYYMRHEIESKARQIGLVVVDHKSISRFSGQHLLVLRKER
jgi:ubiquinone/menaquinone biosynthesis C-methylase UbiE